MEVITKNRKAFFNYEIIERVICGIKLFGSEVKSIRNSDVSIAEAYCFVRDNEMFVTGMHVAEFKQGGKHNNQDPVRERKLLLKKKEIIGLSEEIAQKGLTIIPLCVLMTPTGFIKLEIGLARGKNTVDKRNSIKEKEVKREIDRAKKV